MSPGIHFPSLPGPYGHILVEEHELHVKVKLRCIEKLFEIRIEEQLRVPPALYKEVIAIGPITAESSSW